MTAIAGLTVKKLVRLVVGLDPVRRMVVGLPIVAVAQFVKIIHVELSPVIVVVLAATVGLFVKAMPVENCLAIAILNVTAPRDVNTFLVQAVQGRPHVTVGAGACRQIIAGAITVMQKVYVPTGVVPESKSIIYKMPIKISTDDTPYPGMLMMMKIPSRCLSCPLLLRALLYLIPWVHEWIIVHPIMR